MLGEFRMQNIKKEGVIYTPKSLGSFMGKLLFDASEKYDVRIESILDPSVGVGDLLFATIPFFPNAFFNGIDISPEAIKKSKYLFDSHNIKNYTFQTSNYLRHQIDLSSQEQNDNREPVDAIIANPPYVRTQNLNQQTESLSKIYNIPGKMDLYQAFIIEMTQQLRTGGILCMITSNRYLSTKSGESTRKFLRENFNIIKVIDLGDSKVFDAAILPAIFIGQKIENAENSKVDFQKIYEVEDKGSIFDNSYNNIFEALDLVNDGKEVAAVGDKKLYNIETGTMLLPEKNLEPWTLSSIKEIQWANNIKKDNINFSDVFDVHVGIKTTADKVFIRNDWDKFENSSEKKLLHPLIYSKNIKRWSTDNISLDRTILYPYELVNDKRKLIDLDKYPLTKEYLTQFYTKLDSRTYLKKAGRAWYEVWVPQNPSLMKKPKVVFPDISNKPKFSLDLKGYLVDGNCYWLSLKDGKPTDYLYLAVIVANSVFLQKFHDIEYQNKLYSGKRRYLTQYVSNYPIPNINNNSSKKLIALCKKIISSSEPDLYLSTVSSQIEQLVQQAFKE